MIITRIFGGLGNQMFQYAFARSLACRNNCDFKFDISDFETYNLHSFSLPVFNIKGKIASKKECEELKFKKISFVETVLRSALGKGRKRAESHFLEKNFRFDPAALELKDNVYADGYWQSEKYFSEIKDLIRGDFTLKNEMNDANKKIYEKMQSVNPVSIHIRRGDYVSNPQAKAYHGVDLKEYYDNAILMMKKNIDKLHFFIFSDEPDWVKANFRGVAEFTAVDCNTPENGFEDMRLMSLCSHHIIANSSFSWWGAWLNAGTKKTVIAPKPWFTDKSIDTTDLIPKSWVRL